MSKNYKERCIEYLEKILGTPVEKSKLEFNLGKEQIGVGDIDLFHQIAEALKLSELRKGFAALWYYLKVPDGFEEGEDIQWVRVLHQINNKPFLNKYRNKYTIK